MDSEHSGKGLKAKALRRSVQRQIKAGDVEVAAAGLTAALDRYPRNGRLLHLAGELVRRRRGPLVALGRGQQAQAWLEQALRCRPADPALLRAARDLWRAMGDGEAALRFGQRLARCGPLTAHDLCQQVELWLLAGKPRRAQWCMAGALRRFPADKEVLTLASDVCRLRGQRRRSLAYARLLAQRQPLSWRGYARGAEELLLLARPAEARQLIEQARERMALPELAVRRAAGMRLDVCERYLSNTRTTRLIQAWQACQVWHDPFSCRMPLAMRVPGVPAISLPPPASQACPQPIQYWSQGEPPADVQALSAAWNIQFTGLGLDPIQCFDRPSALAWISEWAPDFQRPFETAFHVAVEADVFRLAYASQRDCLYLDADLAPGPSSASALKVLLHTGHSALFIRSERPTLSNCFFLAREGCPFFALAARSGVRLDFRRLRRHVNTVMNTFGPDKYNYCLRHLFSTNPDPVQVAGLAPGVVQLRTTRFSLGLVNDQVISAREPADLAYKQTDQHWIRAIG